jgi:hypothetical protein
MLEKKKKKTTTEEHNFLFISQIPLIKQLKNVLDVLKGKGLCTDLGLTGSQSPNLSCNGHVFLP